MIYLRVTVMTSIPFDSPGFTLYSMCLSWCDQFNSSGINGPGKGRDDSIGLIVGVSSCIISIHMFDSDSFRDFICFDMIRFLHQCSP